MTGPTIDRQAKPRPDVGCPVESAGDAGGSLTMTFGATNFNSAGRVTVTSNAITL